MSTIIEARPYRSNTTPEEQKALMDRIFHYGQNIIIYDEVPVITTFQLELFTRKFNQLISNGRGYYIVIDISKVKRPPSSESRWMIKKMFWDARDKIIHAAVVYGKNHLTRIAAKVISRKLFNSMSLHSSKQDAFKEIQKHKIKTESNNGR